MCHGMHDDVSTSVRIPNAMYTWLDTQSKIRDCSKGKLLRALLRAARTEFEGQPVLGIDQIWPPIVAPPLHQRVPGRRSRDRKTGQFA